MYNAATKYTPRLANDRAQRSRMIWPISAYNRTDRNPVFLADYHQEDEIDDLSASPHGCRSWRNGFFD